MYEPIQINGPEDVQRMCAQEMYLLRDRVQRGVEDKTRIGAPRLEHTYHPMFEEHRSVYVKNLAAETLVMMMINSWDEIVDLKPSPGEVLMAMRGVSKAFGQMAQGLDPGTIYTITIDREKKE
jgi:hypothetical protein